MFDLKQAMGFDGDVTAIVLNKPQVVVFSHDWRLDDATRESIRHEWNEATRGTELEHVKAVIVDNGLKLSIVDEVE